MGNENRRTKNIKFYDKRNIKTPSTQLVVLAELYFSYYFI